MYDTICTYPLTSDLFAQAIHPHESLVALGTASGHVSLQKLPPLEDGIGAEAGHSTIETTWRTRRHKGSCRSLAFSPDGDIIFSTGKDGLVKAAATATGQVVSKIAVPHKGTALDPACLLHVLSPQTFLLATDSSALHVYDLRQASTFSSSKPQKHFLPHDDYVTSLTSFSPTETSTSGYSKQWVSTGGTSVAVMDLRKGVMDQSEDLGEELLSSIMIGSKVAVGGSSGIIRVWERGMWHEDPEKIVVDRGESLDVLGAVPGDDGCIAVGLGDGHLRLVKITRKGKKVVNEMTHDEIEAVVGLAFEVGGRMISGGGTTVKVWQKSGAETEDHDDEDAEEETQVNGHADQESSGNDSGNDDERPRKRRRKRKKGKAKKNQENRNGAVLFSGLD